VISLCIVQTKIIFLHAQTSGTYSATVSVVSSISIGSFVKEELGLQDTITDRDTDIAYTGRKLFFW